MAFIKQIITDRVVVGGQRYTMTTLGDGRVEIVPSPDSITAAGTPIDKDLLQRYEDFLEEVQNHLNNVSNPHGVTKAQVGLSNVPNVDATNASNIGTGTLNVGRLPSGIPQANITGLVTALADAAAHAVNTSNPHSVTKTQVGLSNVPNVDATNASNIATGTLGVGRLPTGIPQANITGLVAALNAATAHAANTSNPHSVTKAQVGLGSVPDVDATNATNITTGTLNVNRLPTGIPQANISGLAASLSGKQATLVSGTNIKTINGNSVLGSGDINTQEWELLGILASSTSATPSLTIPSNNKKEYWVRVSLIKNNTDFPQDSYTWSTILYPDAPVLKAGTQTYRNIDFGATKSGWLVQNEGNKNYFSVQWSGNSVLSGYAARIEVYGR